MTAIFLPSTRMCGYYKNSVCLNCYAYGAGGPCINCTMYEGLLVGPVDWDEFRIGLDLPADYQEFLNNPSPDNNYINIEMVPPPNGTWENLLFKHNDHLLDKVDEVEKVDEASASEEASPSKYRHPS